MPWFAWPRRPRWRRTRAVLVAPAAAEGRRRARAPRAVVRVAGAPGLAQYGGRARRAVGIEVSDHEDPRAALDMRGEKLRGGPDALERRGAAGGGAGRRRA